MDEIQGVLAKYDEDYVRAGLTSGDGLGAFATTFYADVAEVYDTLTRVRNTERNPLGFTLEDAPILGLLVRMWKLLKEIVRYYQADNAEMVSLLDRLFLEASVTAEYLMRGDPERVLDYRKCSYRHRLRMLSEAAGGSPFYETKAGKRLLSSIRDKLAREGLAPEDFEAQKRNRWRIDGRNFYEIFGEVYGTDLYPMTYGIMSESVHGSWNDSMDFDLLQQDDGTFSAFPFFQPADPRFVGPLVRFSVPPYRAWLLRIDARNDATDRVLDWIEQMNASIYLRFDEGFDGP